jgi:hypothetical protein
VEVLVVDTTRQNEIASDHAAAEVIAAKDGAHDRQHLWRVHRQRPALRVAERVPGRPVAVAVRASIAESPGIKLDHLPCHVRGRPADPLQTLRLQCVREQDPPVPLEQPRSARSAKPSRFESTTSVRRPAMPACWLSCSRS